MTSRAWVIVLFAAFAAFAAPLAHADAPCPQSCITLSPYTECAIAASRDSSVSESCYPYSGQREMRAAFDLVLGTTVSYARSCSFPGPGAYASVESRDRYRVIGPAGGPIAFTARVHANGNSGGVGSVGVTVAEPLHGSAHVDEGEVGGFDQYLELPLSHAPGEEFVIEVYSYASAVSYAQATSELSFTGLPPGYGIASCQGFAGSGAVPTLPSTWGRLKARYR